LPPCSGDPYAVRIEDLLRIETMHHRRTLLLFLCAALIGCDRDSEQSGGTPADSAQAAADAASLTTLLGPLRAISRAEVEYGQLAAQRAGSEAIRQYGQTIAADHRAVMGTLDEMAQRSGATLSETGPAQEMANVVRMAHSGLENLQGADFDLPFIRAEVETQRQLLDRLDQHAIPAATTTELRELMTDMRAMADAHLTRARQLLAQQLGESAEPRPAPAQPRPQAPIGTPAPPPTTSSGG
jgi:predicted outer membrane protein